MDQIWSKGLEKCPIRALFEVGTFRGFWGFLEMGQSFGSILDKFWGLARPLKMDPKMDPFLGVSGSIFDLGREVMDSQESGERSFLKTWIFEAQKSQNAQERCFWGKLSKNGSKTTHR